MNGDDGSIIHDLKSQDIPTEMVESIDLFQLASHLALNSKKKLPKSHLERCKIGSVWLSSYKQEKVDWIFRI